MIPKPAMVTGLLLVVAVLAGSSILTQVTSQSDVTVTSQVTITEPISYLVATEHLTTTQSSRVNGPDRFTINGTTVRFEGFQPICWDWGLAFNGTQGERFHIQWTTSQAPVPLDFYVVTSSFPRSFACGYEGAISTHVPGALFSYSAVNGSVNWTAPSTSEYVALLVNGNPNSVSGTLSIATYSISTISSTSYVTETTTQLVNTVQIVTAGSSILSSGAPSSLLLIGALAAVAIVGFVFYRRRSAASGTSQGAEAMRPLPHPAVKKEPSPLAAPPPPSAVVVQPSGEQPPVVGQRASLISTGYPELDQILSGGLPERYAILFASPSYDERDLLLRKIIESNSLSGNPSFYVSGDMRKLEDLSGKYHNNFFALCSQAGKLTSEYVNLFNLPTLENLSEFNISLTHMLRGIPVRQGARKIMIIDFLSDVLLHHKLPTTRRWLSDFLTRRKADGFTVLATFNPLIAAREEVQTIMDSFDGVIEIYEKELKERSRRFLTIKKMYGLRYSESELMLDKDELY